MGGTFGLCGSIGILICNKVRVGGAHAGRTGGDGHADVCGIGAAGGGGASTGGAAQVGGLLFDTWSPTGPFLMFACVNALVAILAAVVMWRTQSTSLWADQSPSDVRAAAEAAADDLEVRKSLITNGSGPINA